MRSPAVLGLLTLALAAASPPARPKAVPAPKETAAAPVPQPPPPAPAPAAIPVKEFRETKEPVRTVDATGPRDGESGSATVSMSSPPAPRLRLTPKVGMGFTSEDATDGATVGFSVGGSLEFSFTPAISLGLDVRDLFYRRTYLGLAPDLEAGSASRTTLDEQKVGADLLVELELFRLFKAPLVRPRLSVLVGPSFRFFHNDAFRTQAGSVAAGLAAGWAFNERLDFRAGGLYAYNFIFKNEGLPSALGGPKSVTSFFGSIGLRLAPEARLGIGYEGELVELEASTRLYHSLCFSLELGLL